MEKKTILFWQWILQRWKTGVLFLGISGIYFLMCWLYGLELVGAFYAYACSSGSGFLLGLSAV